MTEDAQNIENLIREYLLDERSFQKRINNSELKFGFQFIFPSYPSSSEQKGQVMVVFQLNNTDFLIISIGTQISKSHIDILKKYKEREVQFFIDLKKLIFKMNLFFRLDIQNYNYEISEQIFIEHDKIISKNIFFKIVRKLYNTQAYSSLLLMEHCMDKQNLKEINKEQRIDTNIGLNLYI
ncbi:MAG: DUF2299 family protein [Candidatus Lokiarchaeota archaeon]|nr:DUF2299 family protein [Candidatus Lokiarchaeota archaeon]